MKHTQPQNLRLLLILTTVSVALSACTASPSRPPIVEGSDTAPITREPTVLENGAVVDADPQQERTLPPTAATASLLAAAQGATDEQNYGDAISYLERAVRIAPRDAALWVELSQAHLADGNTTAATQHARKAIALAGSDAALVRLGWLQMANVREAEGNVREARAIRRRFASLRG